MLENSVADPDPNPSVFGPPGSGSGSVSTRCGSGSGSFHKARKVRKNLSSYCFCDFVSQSTVFPLKIYCLKESTYEVGTRAKLIQLQKRSILLF